MNWSCLAVLDKQDHIFMPVTREYDLWLVKQTNKEILIMTQSQLNVWDVILSTMNQFHLL